MHSLASSLLCADIIFVVDRNSADSSDSTIKTIQKRSSYFF